MYLLHPRMLPLPALSECLSDIRNTAAHSSAYKIPDIIGQHTNMSLSLKQEKAWGLLCKKNWKQMENSYRKKIVDL